MATTKPSPEQKLRVLVVDDDHDDFVLTRDYLDEVGKGRYEVEWARTYQEGLEAICEREHDVFLIDYRLGAKSGFDLIKEAQERRCFGPVIILTGQSDFELDYAALRAGAADFLEKPKLDAVMLDRSIRYTLQQYRYENELSRQVSERTAALKKINETLEQEIAERRRVEEALKEEDRRKDKFMALLAHELRNPLAPIRNALEIMRLANHAPPEVRRARQVVERQVAQLIRLVDDLLDVARINQGKLKLILEEVPLSEVLESAIEISHPLLAKSHLHFEAKLGETNLRVRGDRIRLAQVFANLLNNAAKYTEPGGTVLLSAAQQDAQALVTVADTGVGIPPDQLEHVFDVFTQVDRHQNRSQGGLGIGLSLVKNLVELHGGEVWAESAGPHQGSRFHVRLPLLP